MRKKFLQKKLVIVDLEMKTFIDFNVSPIGSDSRVCLQYRRLGFDP